MMNSLQLRRLLALLNRRDDGRRPGLFLSALHGAAVVRLHQRADDGEDEADETQRRKREAQHSRNRRQYQENQRGTTHINPQRTLSCTPTTKTKPNPPRR